MKDLRYELNQKVRITCSGEEGKVIGRAEYAEADNTYFIRYKAADGRAVESWWPENSIKAV